MLRYLIVNDEVIFVQLVHSRNLFVRYLNRDLQGRFQQTRNY
jgi:hypothetical protein